MSTMSRRDRLSLHMTPTLVFLFACLSDVMTIDSGLKTTDKYITFTINLFLVEDRKIHNLHNIKYVLLNTPRKIAFYIDQSVYNPM